MGLFITILTSNEISSAIDKYIELVKEILLKLILKTIGILIAISRPLYILLIMVGIILYALPVNPYKSRKVLWGGIILFIFTEFILPILQKSLLKM